MNKNTSALRVHRCSSGHETLESRSLPVLGADRKRLSPWHVFWRNYALVLTVATLLRIAADIAGR